MDNERIYLFNDFTLDLARGCLTQGGESIHLRPQSYEVLKYLVLNSGHLITKDKLIDEIWQGRAVTDGSLGKCIEEVREAFGPDARQYVRNVRGRGYIFDPKTARNGESVSIRSEEVEFLSVVVEDEVDDETIVHAPVTTARAMRVTKTPSEIANEKGIVTKGKRVKLVVALLVLLLVAVPLYLYATRHGSEPPQIDSIAVMPFTNESGNAELEYLSDGLTDSLISGLARLPRLSVKSRSAVFRYKGRNIEPQQVASDLSVKALLNGRLVQQGEDVSVYLSLVDGRTGNHIWGEQYSRRLTDVVNLQNDLARDVSQQLRLRLTNTETQQLTRGGTQNNEAYTAYLKARYYWGRPKGLGFANSLDYFQQAIELDPNYALAQAGLSHYYGFAAATGQLPPDENWPKSETALSKAMAIDDRVAESFNALAGIQLYYHRDWPAAERSFRHGIELNPSSAEVHHHYGRCLSLFGRNEEAITELQRAIELEPLSLRYNLNLGILFFSLRDYDRAINQIRKTLELEPNFAPAHDWLGNAYEKKGMQREAVAEWTRALVLSGHGERAAHLERNYAGSGFEFAVRVLAQQRLQALNETAKRGDYVPASEYVNAYMRMAKKDPAFEWLEKALQERSRFAFEVKRDPLYDDLRSDPRFEELLRRAGFTSKNSPQLEIFSPQIAPIT